MIRSGKLEIGAGEPAALADPHNVWIARSRYAPLLSLWGTGQTITNPAEFSASPYLRRFYPNFLWLECSPLEGLEVTAEYWVPDLTP